VAFKKEKNLLKILCRGYLEDLIAGVGWTPLEQDIIRMKYIEHKEIADIVFDLSISEATYVRYFDVLCAKLHTHLKRNPHLDVIAFY